MVDISADFRLHELTTYERTYGDHGAPELLAEAVYGLPELHRDRIAEAQLVANPGCYPTAALLALAPLAEAGLLGDAVISAASGVSGAGRGGGDRLHFVNVDENFSAYGMGGHRHAPEIAQELSELGSTGQTTFVPHLLPLDQGLLASCYVRLADEASEDEIRSLYAGRYAAEPFVEVVDDPPGVRDVRDTNLCRVRSRSTGHRPGAGVRGDRQPLEGSGRPGDPEPEPDARPARDGGAEMTGGFFRSRWVQPPAGLEELDPGAAGAGIPRRGGGLRAEGGRGHRHRAARL